MKQKEIWLINLDPTVGAEIHKKRPALIVNDDALGALPLKVIVPITDWKARYKDALWMVKIAPDSINNLAKVSAIDTFQIRSISTKRFIKKIGSISDEFLIKVQHALECVLSIYRI
jgi:mRNA interferase MazF